MTTIASSSVNIQTSAQSVPSVPAWFGEVTIIAHYLTGLESRSSNRKKADKLWLSKLNEHRENSPKWHYLTGSLGILDAVQERVRFARRRFGQYEVIDFVVVLIGYAISGERTLEAFYERLPSIMSTSTNVPGQTAPHLGYQERML